MIQVPKTVQFGEKMLAMNEALMLGSLRQHELTEAAESLNAQLRVEMAERRQAEEALRESEERYRNLFNSIDEGFCIVEMIFDQYEKPVDYRFLQVNPSFEKQSGIHEAAGKRMREIAPDFEAYWFETFGKVALTGEPVRFVNESKALDGRWYDVYAFRFGTSGSRKIAILLSNITERRKAEEILREAQTRLADRAGQLEGLVTERTAELTATNKQLEAFVYSIAHDLRAPLRSMQGFSTMLVEEAGAALSETGRDFANRINKSAQFMDTLLLDLLAFSRISQQRIELTSVNLENLVQFMLSGLEKQIQEKNARVETVGPWPEVLGHDATLGQVLVNLVNNALKFVPPNVPPLIRLRAEERPGRMNGSMDQWMSEPSAIHPPPPPEAWIRVWVEDNGIGIASDHQNEVFKLFTRLHGEIYPGTGLGLAIVEKGIERMGGRVGVESTPGHGSRFWFELRKA